MQSRRVPVPENKANRVWLRRRAIIERNTGAQLLNVGTGPGRLASYLVIPPLTWVGAAPMQQFIEGALTRPFTRQSR